MMPTLDQRRMLLEDYKRLGKNSKNALRVNRAGFRTHRVVGFTYYNWNHSVVYDNSCVGGN